MTYFQGYLPSPRATGFHAAVREFEAARSQNRTPSGQAIADAAGEFAEPGDELWTMLYDDDADPNQGDTLDEIDAWLNQIDGEDFEREFRILLNGLRSWVETWDNMDYGW